MGDALQEYRRKRDFARTPEPSGQAAPDMAVRFPRFVVQMHDARRLHYDVRLEAGGVLKSWAVPKGPSADPADKRLAVMTEDHPVDYASFEGYIPDGAYGAGPVIVWDEGVYALVDDRGAEKVPTAPPRDEIEAAVLRQVDEGKVVVWLQGHKLRGGYAFVRTRGRNGAGGARNWLLIKMDDQAALPGQDLVGDRPESVVSGRRLEEVRAAQQAGRRQADGDAR